MKKSELFFSALQVPVDYAMIVAAGIFAYLLRVAGPIQKLRPVFYELSLRSFLEMLLPVAFFFILIYAAEGLYAIRTTKMVLGEIYRVFRATAIAVMLLIIFIFFDPQWFSSRFIVLAGGFLIFIFVVIGRTLLGAFQRFLLVSRGLGVHRLLMVGVSRYCTAINRTVEKEPGMGYRVVGHIEDVDLERIDRINKMKGIDEVVQCSSDIKKRDLMLLKEYCIRNRIGFKYAPNTIQTANYKMEIFLGEPLIEIQNTPLDGWGKIIKRAFDIVGATVGIIVFGPVMLLAALAILIESGRPVIFLNRRVGHQGEFDVLKFRYMKKKYSHGKQFSEEHNKQALEFLDRLIKERSIKQGPLYKIKDDPRRTKLGTLLEKLSIDELPQFFNVLKGEMSLVGPRPHQPLEVAKYENYQKRVLTIKPGITGMAQVSGRSDLKFEDEVRLDIFYIENWSLWGDIKIIMKTIPAIIRRRKN